MTEAWMLAADDRIDLDGQPVTVTAVADRIFDGASWLRVQVGGWPAVAVDWAGDGNQCGRRVWRCSASVRKVA